MIKELCIKYKSFLIYGIVGCLATAINIGVYLLSYKVLSIPNVPSNMIAWTISVLFAFITNKIFVFESMSMRKSVVMLELGKFILARLSTGFLDLLIMFLAVDVMVWNAAVWKTLSNILVIIGNYILSRFVVFGKRDTV